MAELKTVKDMIGLSVGTGVLALDKAMNLPSSNKWRSDVGKVVAREVGKIAIHWADGKTTWYDNHGYFWSGRDKLSYGSYSGLMNQRHAKIFSLSKTEYTYFKLFMEGSHEPI